MQNPVMNYAWGSKTFIADILGNLPSDKPIAELWLGAHPKAPSSILVNGKPVALNSFIAHHKETIGNNYSHLPFLLKILAAAQPLSIHAHPDRRQAEDGYNREQAMGISLRNINRTYLDPNHKPELLCALTPFSILAGFRSVEDVVMRFEIICSKSFSSEIENLRSSGNLQKFFSALMTLSAERKKELLSEALTKAALHEEDPAFTWIVRLNRKYPGDPNILSPAFLNFVLLQPGEALFISSGVIHSYLDGVGIEIMTNSDNTLRSGLTGKRTDIEDFLRIVKFKPEKLHLITPRRLSESEKVYDTSTAEYELSVIELDSGLSYEEESNHNVEILLCTHGHAMLKSENECIQIGKGTSLFVPASSGPFKIEGRATIYKARVP